MKRFVVKSSTIAALALATLPLVACGGGGDSGTPDAGGNTEGTYTHYVNDTILVPLSPAQAKTLSLDLDGDGEEENKLGGVLSLLASRGVNIQDTVDEAIAGGDLITLHSLQAKDLTNATNAGWKVLLGAPADPPPNYDGTDALTVSPDSPTNGLMTGNITGGLFEGGPGNVTIALSLTAGTPVQVKLIGARVKANVTATGCTDGVLGGAITKEELDGSVFPGVVDLLNASIADDAPAGADGLTACTNDDPCMVSRTGKATTCDTTRMVCRSESTKTVFDIFDNNPADATITLEEIKANPLVTGVLEPDLDLLDGSDNFNPNQDGVFDSVSVGIGFTCKNATFTVSGE
jgi:hypothetical protein